MRANFIYSNLNPCGGGERFTLVTMKAVYEMGLEIDLTTLEQPNLSKLENAFGRNLASIIKKIRKINLLNMFDEQSIHLNLDQTDYDLIINSHGDIDPYYDSSLNANNLIVYCHYPSAKIFIENEDLDYLTHHLKIDRLYPQSINELRISSQLAYKNSNQLTSQTIEPTRTEFKMDDQNCNRKEYVKWAKNTYDSMIRNSLLITNSNYSKTAIFKEYDRDDVIVLNPPVDVDTIISKVKLDQRYNAMNPSDENNILVICRIDPTKRIENVIYLARLIKERKIKTKINILGNLQPFHQKYCDHLIKLISDYDIPDIVELHIDASFQRLIDFMKKSKIFFHPREGEHFGMSIVEAMSGGLIPVVPAMGGQSEFVPKEYQYSSLEQAILILSSLLIDMPREHLIKESEKMKNMAKNFSETNYKRKFQMIVSQLLYTQSN